jgi:hypothetical protein
MQHSEIEKENNPSQNNLEDFDVCNCICDVLSTDQIMDDDERITNPKWEDILPHSLIKRPPRNTFTSQVVGHVNQLRIERIDCIGASILVEIHLPKQEKIPIDKTGDRHDDQEKKIEFFPLNILGEA